MVLLDLLVSGSMVLSMTAAKSIGDWPCKSDNDCGTNQMCDRTKHGQRCLCTRNYFFWNSECWRARYYMQHCTIDQECTFYDKHTMCDKVCMCQSGFRYVSTVGGCVSESSHLSDDPRKDGSSGSDNAPRFADVPSDIYPDGSDIPEDIPATYGGAILVGLISSSLVILCLVAAMWCHFSSQRPLKPSPYARAECQQERCDCYQECESENEKIPLGLFYLPPPEKYQTPGHQNYLSIQPEEEACRCSPMPHHSSMPPRSPMPRHSPVPQRSPVSQHSPVPKRSPVPRPNRLNDLGIRN